MLRVMVIAFGFPHADTPADPASIFRKHGQQAALIQHAALQAGKHQVYTEACIANAYEIQPGGESRAKAAEARGRLGTLMAEAGKGLSKTCSICLEELHPEQPSPATQLVGVVIPCMHCYHLACAVEWRRRQRTCPLCQGDPYSLDQMLYAISYISGRFSHMGKLSRKLLQSGGYASSQFSQQSSLNWQWQSHWDWQG